MLRSLVDEPTEGNCFTDIIIVHGDINYSIVYLLSFFREAGFLFPPQTNGRPLNVRPSLQEEVELLLLEM